MTVVVLELHRYSPEAFATELEKKIQQAPQLLQQSPVVIHLEKYADEDSDIDLGALLELCRAHSLQPIGFRSCPRFNAAIRDTGLALLPATVERSGTPLRESTPRDPGEAPDSPAKEPAPKVDAPARRGSLLITKPVRSGQQIYAKEADLIVMSPVSEGAELLADGNIHAYGGLRGRALAGVRGDSTARIFCQSMEAELVSVAGNFVLSDEFREELWRKPVQVYMEDDNLCLEPL